MTLNPDLSQRAARAMQAKAFYEMLELPQRWAFVDAVAAAADYDALAQRWKDVILACEEWLKDHPL